MKIPKSKTKKTKTKKQKVSLGKTIKYELKRMAETKINDVESKGNLIYGYIDATTVYSLLPAISQGTGQGARVGNKIDCSNLNLKLSIYCYNQTATNPPTYFDIYIFKIKTKNVGGGFPSSADMVQFLEDGSTSKQYTGGALDGMRYLNDDLFTLCKKKRITLYNPYGSTVIAATSSINPHRYFNINLTKYVKKSWLFNDAGTTIENDNLYLAIGSTLTSGNTLPVTTLFGDFSYLIQAKFKDV